MKRLLALSLLLAVVAIAPLFAYEDLPTRMEDVKLRKNTFDYLAKQTYVDLSAVAVTGITPTDTTSTGTAAVSYQGTVEPPFLLRIQNPGPGSVRIYFAPYETTTDGLRSPTATCSFVLDSDRIPTATPTIDLQGLSAGGVWEKVFYQDPNLTFDGAASVTFTIWTRPTE